MSEPADYQVGYGRPPLHSRFKPGRSGNPRGRPRTGSRSFLALLGQALEERVVVNEQGVRKSITKCEALAKQFANKGAAGDLKAAKVILALLKQIEELQSSRLDEYRSSSERGKSAREIIMERIERLRQCTEK
jgi:Family of unknown function (DUF5681)